VVKFITWTSITPGIHMIHIGCFFKFGIEVGVEESIVNALYRLQIRDQLFTPVVRSQSTLQRLLRGEISKNT
jgi:hypothetical protein